jgi:hypothetical protein
VYIQLKVREMNSKNNEFFGNVIGVMITDEKEAFGNNLTQQKLSKTKKNSKRLPVIVPTERLTRSQRKEFENLTFIAESEELTRARKAAGK